MNQRIVLVIAAAVFCMAKIGLSSSENSEQHLFTAGGEVKRAVPLDKKMVSALRMDAAYPHIFGTNAPAKDDLFVSPVHLNNKKEMHFIVIGRKGLSGVGKDSVVFWIMRQKKGGFEVLNNFGGQQLEIKDNQTNGYRDLELRSTSSGIGRFITSLTYDARAQTYKASGGSMERETPVPESKPPRVVEKNPGDAVPANAFFAYLKT
jgi:hypothetical protein